MEINQIYAFRDQSLLTQGLLIDVAQFLKKQQKQLDNSLVLLFEASTGRQLDLDLSGSQQDLEDRYGSVAQIEDDCEPVAGTRKRGRPKLGVVGREVTLLPRHWDWLESQSGGASAALRRLVDQARKEMTGKEMIRQSQDAAQRFMTAIAGNLPGYEEAVRALYACDKARFDHETANWPVDVRKCARKYAEHALK